LTKKSMKKTLFLFIILFSVHLNAQEGFSPKKNTQKGFITVDFLSTEMPDDILTGNPEVNMGLTGIHYNLWITDKIYGGLGFYGAVSGKRGGLFTLGLNLGTKIPLTKKLFLDTGFHLGAGGGVSAPDGGGAFILPHINMGYQFKNFTTVAGVNYINFFDNGNIEGIQLTAGIQIPVSFDYTDFDTIEKSYSFNNLVHSAWNQKSKKISLMMHFNHVHPTGNSKISSNGGILPLKGKTIHLAGFEINSYFSSNWFGFFKVDGAYHGIRGGYMDILTGAGYHLSLNNKRTNILGKFGIGAGGGGGILNGGGLLLYPDISIEQHLYKNVYLAINKGFLLNPSKIFTSKTIGFGLKYYVDYQGITSEDKNLSSFKIKGIEFIVAEDVYLNAKRMISSTVNLFQFSFQANVFLNKYLYLAGKTSFANFGDAGAYAEGIVGLGIRSKPLLNNKISVFTQGLAGAAGGGDVSTGQGFIIKPSVGVYYHMNNTLNLRTEIGYVKAKGGLLSSPYFSVGLSYQIGVLTSN